ncbi:M56 family metallopeptidase [Eudoraea chungangensis]|uniref:M56 family metallopeptidase n=1 Tax=Eudoraea chungangensis TaxID=1481905 RepID=UPI0023ED5192|nr:M56 family metallopeptidase [Eudoraea chungangensis]
MEIVLIHLTKAAVILSLFYLVYQLLLKMETFYVFNRIFLLIGLIVAFALPFIRINSYEEVSSIVLEPMELVSINESSNALTTMNWTGILFYIYILGALLLVFRMGLQLMSIRKVIKCSHKIKKDGFYLIESQEKTAPFSFFKYIFYNPQNYSQEELEAILKHEKAHSAQWHSLDLLLAHITNILMWINPFSWLYKKTIEHNLEFLADQTAIQTIASSKTYKYTLLKVSGNNFISSITNNFYNSLIKKRIVMLHKSKSNQTKALKALVMLPLLAVFLLSFNTRTIYVPTERPILPKFSMAEGQSIQLRIDKNTSNEELEEMKQDLKKKGVDFSYTVVHNEKMEIIEIEIDMVAKEGKGKSFRGSSSFDNEGKPIDPITVFYDEESNTFFAGNKDAEKQMNKNSTYEKADIYNGQGTSQRIEITEENGKRVVVVNGEEMLDEDIKIVTSVDNDKVQHIVIDVEDDVDYHKEIIINGDEEVKIETSGGGNVFVLDTEEDGKNMLYLLNGKKISKKEFKSIAADKIETISVYKGDKAKEKYGKKAADGVVEITTKKEN